MNELIHNVQRSQSEFASHAKKIKKILQKLQLGSVPKIQQSVKIPRKTLDFRRFHFHLILKKFTSKEYRTIVISVRIFIDFSMRIFIIESNFLFGEIPEFFVCFRLSKSPQCHRLIFPFFRRLGLGPCRRRTSGGNVTRRNDNFHCFMRVLKRIL